MSAALRRLQFALSAASAGVLGLTTGALLAEGAILVPWWSSLEPAAFLTWYADHADPLFHFFAPLEIAAALLAVSAAAFERWQGNPKGGFHLAAALLAVAVLAAFPLYFDRVNVTFATGSIPLDDVAEELARWGRWHWARSALELTAFAAALLGLRESGRR